LTDLDFSPLERRQGLLSRVRSLGASPIQVVGATIGGLILFGPLIGILVAVLRPGTDWGFVGTMALFAACGAWALFDVLRKAGTGAGLEGLADANGLTLQRSVEARHYTGSRFRSGERVILHSLRTRTSPILEVGDTWPTKRVRFTMSSSGAVSAQNAPQAEGFVRVVLPSGDHPTPRTFPMTAQLDEALWRLLGVCSLELHGREITVMGSQPLEPESPERLTEAFQLAGAIARLAGAPQSTGADAPPPEPAQRGSGRRTRHPLKIVCGVLAFVVVVSVAFAIVMSNLEELSLGEAGIRTVLVWAIIPVIGVLMALLLRWATARPRSARRRDRGSLRERRRSGEDAMR
jgi:hypothetical protein